MKTRMKLSAILPHFDSAIQESVEATLKASGLSVADAELKRSGMRDEDMKLEDGSRACIHRVSTRDVDRSGDVMIQNGIDLGDFKKNPVVMWAHNYREPQIGSDEWIKMDDSGYSLIAKTVYATTPRGNEVWTLRKEGHLKTSSIGFIPIEVIRESDSAFVKMCDKFTSDWPEFKKQRERCRAIVKRSLLLEHSDVPIPDNQNALTLAIAKSMNLSAEMIDALDIDGGLVKVTPALVAELMGIDIAAVSQKDFEAWLKDVTKAKNAPPPPAPVIKILGHEPKIKVLSLPGIVVDEKSTLEEKVKNLLDLRLGKV